MRSLQARLLPASGGRRSIDRSRRLGEWFPADSGLRLLRRLASRRPRLVVGVERDLVDVAVRCPEVDRLVAGVVRPVATDDLGAGGHDGTLRRLKIRDLE